MIRSCDVKQHAEEGYERVVVQRSRVESTVRWGVDMCGKMLKGTRSKSRVSLPTTFNHITIFFLRTQLSHPHLVFELFVLQTISTRIKPRLVPSSLFTTCYKPTERYKQYSRHILAGRFISSPHYLILCPLFLITLSPPNSRPLLPAHSLRLSVF